jgi:hypothetical protein
VAHDGDLDRGFIRGRRIEGGVARLPRQQRDDENERRDGEANPQRPHAGPTQHRITPAR